MVHSSKAPTTTQTTTSSPGWHSEAERQLWRAICAPNHWFAEDGTTATHPHSLDWFVRVCWGTEWFFRKHPEQPHWLYDPIHVDYLAWLQKYLLQWKLDCQRGEIRRMHLAVVLPRGYGKTVTATKSAPLWTHLDEPDMSTIFCSASGALSIDTHEAIQSVISGEDQDSWFVWLYGNWKRGSAAWRKEYCVHGYRTAANLSESSFDTTGVDTGMTGYHHRQHIWDDPIVKNKLREGGVYMTAVHDAVNASYNALQTNGLLMFVLTRYADDDVAGRHFKEEGIATWSGMPCPHDMIFDKIPMGEGIWHVYFYQTEDELTGEPTHPLLWTRQTIKEAKSRDPEDFACQQQNNPGTGERAPLLESQVPELYVDYRDFLFTVPVEYATVHIDTAFKKLETVRTGDDNAIVAWLHDARRNGVIYLDTDMLRCSNEWREEQFNDELIKVLLSLRRRAYRVKAITDEVEPGGKAGSYKNRILGIVKSAGLRLHPDDFKQLNRTSNKKARIRTAAGHWAEGYVRILLHKDTEGRWIIPPVVKKLLNQIIHIDAVKHEDLADAATDGFIEGLWRRPDMGVASPSEGVIPLSPGDAELKSFGGPPAIGDVFETMDYNRSLSDMVRTGFPSGPFVGRPVYDTGEDEPLPFDPV